MDLQIAIAERHCESANGTAAVRGLPSRQFGLKFQKKFRKATRSTPTGLALARVNPGHQEVKVTVYLF